MYKGVKMALPNNTIKLSDMTTASDLTPADYIPIVRHDSADDDYDNYKVAASKFISYPNGYLEGGIVTTTSSAVTVGVTYCRDRTNAANIFLTASASKSINSSLFTSSSLYSSSGTRYFIVCRVSASDQTATFFVSNSKTTVPTGYAYARAVGQAYYNGTSHTFSNVWCYDNEIDVVQTTNITEGSALTSGHIALVID